MNDDDVPYVELTEAQRQRFEAAAERALATRRRQRRSISNGRRGRFAPGRYAWLLTDITPCNPQPAKGRQGLWDWEAS